MTLRLAALIGLNRSRLLDSQMVPRDLIMGHSTPPSGAEVVHPSRGQTFSLVRGNRT